MLSLFPSLLSYQFFAITLIRVAAALVLFWIAYGLTTKRREIARTRFPVIPHMPEWATLLYALVALATGALLFVGLFTQAAAIAGMVIAIDHSVMARRYPHLVAISTAAGLLLLVMCLSLLFFGAGAFGFDLPL